MFSSFQKLRLLTTPTVKWGPALPKYRALVNYVTDFEVDPYPKKQKEPPKSFDNKAFVNDSATCSRSASRLLVSIHTVFIIIQYIFSN